MSDLNSMNHSLDSFSTPGAAYVANYEGPADEGWYLDSGATHHLTNNMANMHIMEQFSGSDQLIIGNGQVSSESIGTSTSVHPAQQGVNPESQQDTVQEALNDSKWLQAMKEEYDALIKNDTWILVPRQANQQVVENKWIYRIKYNTDGSVAKYKARLVAKGFQQVTGVNYFETFSPVIKPATVRVVLSLAVMNQWKDLLIVRNPIMCVDYIRACMDSNKLQEPGPNTAELESFIVQFNTTFALKDLGILSYFLGVEVLYDAGCIYLSQKKYVRDLLSKVEMLNCKGIDTLMITGTKLQKVVQGELGSYLEDPSHYKIIVGGMQYLILTRPEIAFAVNKLSQYISAPTLQHLMACKRVLKYLQSTQDYGLKFIREGSMQLTGFTDADWVCDLDDRKSIGSYCIYLGNNLISWSSKKQYVVTRSSAESEYRALAATSAELTWLQSLFTELGINCTDKPTIWCDNISATELARNPVYHSRTKHIEIDMHFIRNKVVAGELRIKYVPSEEQVADIMTKPLSFVKFNYLRFKLNVHLCPLSLRGAVKIAHYEKETMESRRRKSLS
ncbi:retrovirus-related pol polyprotein from transposon RE2 [Citrus sinensis]|uniref:Retrovirus-related pol polyprotein from transposon RE2 n=1 Tax=Citrus sinensis TaxID=2711 RepID=A0ACB8IJQ3_CITSI|nr:retrovirus-related pol polyprotein from transposon RE2 [Citrus sinensis]